ncbi:MAG: alpha/beta-hydrolase N-terminal domain-containing protein, partial [Actinomycetota bacterium]|nr:alpha/beta-hydrolase N-terminal domain-containing protein [Actinomycetota bacterium]
MLAPPAAFGVVGGVILWWWSLTPTLLPRAWMIQAAISALSIAIGYGVGSAVGAGVRWVTDRFEWSGWSGRNQRAIWMAASVAGAVIAVGGGVLWFVWQNEQRDLVGMAHLVLWSAVAMVGLATVITIVLIMVGRLVGFGIVRLDGFLARWLP